MKTLVGMYYIVYFSNENGKIYSSIVECKFFNPIEFANEMLPSSCVILNWKKLSKEEEDNIVNYMDDKK